ncbi:MAG: DinB family protein [Bacteroidetes bacterium]|nr:DinB family protein [Bacteroidota bacterium]
MQQLKWIERKFNFGYTPEYLPLYIERLRSTAPRIEELVRNLSDEQASFMPEGKWSVKQHIGHLTDLEELHEGRLEDFLAHKNPLRAADMNNKKTEDADHNKRSLPELIREFRASREKFIEQTGRFSEAQLQFRSFHPRLQVEINVIDLLHFVAEHDLFHQLHIRNIINA